MSFLLRLTLAAAAAFSLASCGGGSVGAPPLPSSGKVADGYLDGASVLCDSNGNGLADDGEVVVTTSSQGGFTFAAPGCASGLVARGGREVDTGVTFKGVMKAPAGAKMVTPFTTLMVGGMTQDRVIAALGLPAGTDIPKADPVGNTALARQAAVVEMLFGQTAYMFGQLVNLNGSAGEAVYNEVAGAFAVLLQGGGTLITGNTVDSILLAQMVKVAAQRIAQAPAVPADVRAAVSALNAESLGIVTSGALVVLAQEVLAPDATVLAVTEAKSDTNIPFFVKDHAAELAKAPSSATYALGAELTEQVLNGSTPEQPAAFPIDFETSVPTAGFGGGEGSSVEPGPAGGSGKSLKVLRSGGEVYAGAFVTTVPIPFKADQRTITARVYSPKAGIRMVLKAEGAGGLTTAEYDATTPVIVGWQTLTWVANNVNLSQSYTQITLLPNLGAIDPAPGVAYYFDDIKIVADSVTPPSSETPLPINFDDASPTTMGQFGAGAAIAVAAGPTGGSGNAAKFTKSAGDTWAGFYFPTATIPFSATQRTLTARVYSPKAGAVMVMKAENGDGKTSSGEVPATATTVVGWQTLTWVFTSTVDLSKTYNSIAIIPDSGVVGAGQAYYFDDITLVTDTVVPPPVTDYLAVTADSISLVNGPSKTVYTMSQFESDAGISVSWPIPSPVLMKVALTETGNVTLPVDHTVEAAVSITETVAGGKGEIQAYIAKVSVKKTATGLEINVPTTAADSLAYTVSTDAKKKLIIDFASGVKGLTASLTTAANMTNSLVFGEVVQYAINQVSNDFTGINALRGKYRMTVVLSGMPLRRADGTALPTLSVVVPTELNSSGSVVKSKTITGPGLVGYVTLTN